MIGLEPMPLVANRPGDADTRQESPEAFGLEAMNRYQLQHEQNRRLIERRIEQQKCFPHTGARYSKLFVERFRALPSSPWCKSGFVRKKSEVSTDIVCRIALWRWARASSGRSKRGCGSRTQNWHRRRGIPSTRS